MPTLNWGPQALLNTTTAGTQQDVSVAVLDDGRIMTSWTDLSGLQAKVFTQNYNADGTPDGTEYALAFATGADIAGRPGGGFYMARNFQNQVVFETDFGDGGFSYDYINAPGGFAAPEIAAAADGSVAVVYESGAGGDIKLRLRDGDAGHFGAEIAVNTSAPNGDKNYGTVALLGNGNIVVAWNGAGDAINYRVFNAVGVPVSGQMTASAHGGELALTAFGSGFMLSWHDGNQPAAVSDVRGMLFDASGFNVSAFFNVGEAGIPGNWPALINLGNGRVMAAWISNGAVRGRVFDPVTGLGDGAFEIAPAGSATASGFFNSNASLALMEDGRVAVTWSTPGGDVAMQIVDPRLGVINGTPDSDTLYGHDLVNDAIKGGTGADFLFGLGGNDVIEGGSNSDAIEGGTGNDRIYAASAVNPEGSISGDSLDGGKGNDVIFGAGGTDQVVGEAGNDVVTGGAGGDILDGGAGHDRLSYARSTAGVVINLGASTASGGDAQGDVIADFEHVIGSSHNDTMVGSDDANRLTGGEGLDKLTGGLGRDIFDFNAIIESKFATRDVITDFNANAQDRIDLSSIDLVIVGAIDAFTFIGSTAFSGHGQVRAFQNGANTVVDINTEGSNAADMRILLSGQHTLDAGDFIF